MLFINPKGLQIMGKGGKISTPLPSRMADSSLAEIDDKTGAVEVPVRRRLPAGTIAEDELRLSVKEVLLVVAIGVGSWGFERLGV